MNHKEKVKLARRLSGRQTGHFESDEWNNHKKVVENRVQRTIENQRKKPLQ